MLHPISQVLEQSTKNKRQLAHEPTLSHHLFPHTFPTLLPPQKNNLGEK